MSDVLKNQLNDLLREYQILSGIKLNVDSNDKEELIRAINEIKTIINLKKMYIDEKKYTSKIISAYLKGLVDEGDFLNNIDQDLVNDKAKHIILLYNKEGFDKAIFSVLNELCYNLSTGIVVPVEKNKIVILIYKNTDKDFIREKLMSLIDTINSEVMCFVKGIYSEAFFDLRNIKILYCEANRQSDILEIFQSTKVISKLGDIYLEKIIYDTNLDRCKKLLEMICKNGYDIFCDEEMVHTVNAYFDNNMNIAATSKLLHMHRNTLIYRLEQISQKIGIDIKTFKGGVDFMLAENLYLYIKYKENL